MRMARKEQKNAAQHRGFSDIIGIVLIATALLLMVAQLSFHPQDVSSNRIPSTETVHNLIGSAGAHCANGLFFLFGAGAFVLPVLLMLFGLGYLFELMSYLKRRWAWAAVLFLTCLGFFDLYSAQLETLRVNLNAPSAGGLLGQVMNSLVFGHFGKPGATIIFITLYAISLIFLTNFHLGIWLRGQVAARQAAAESEDTEPVGDATWSPEEKTLAKKARDLEKQARKLQQQLDKPEKSDKPVEREKSGLGADGRPVPAPTVRDLSVPNARTGKPPRPRVEEPVIEKDAVEGEVISATEIAAASTADILGKGAGPSKRNKTEEDDSGPAGQRAVGNPDAEKSEADKLEPVAASAPVPPPDPRVTDNTISPRRPPLKKKPISVAATPHIGNYQ